MKKCKVLPPLTDLQLEVINGSLLGDACIVRHKNKPNYNAWFNLAQREACQDLVHWHADILEGYFGQISNRPRKKIIHVDGKMKVVPEVVEGTLVSLRSVAHENFTVLHTHWYGTDWVKRVPKDLKLTPLMIALWHVEDGQNVPTRRSAYFHTDGFDLESCDHLVAQLGNFGLSARVSMVKGRPKIRVNSNSYLDFIELIRPYVVWESFRYKIDTSKYVTPRPQIGETHRFAKITQGQVFQILADKRKGARNCEIARQYGLHPGLVSKIVLGQRWKHLTKEMN